MHWKRATAQLLGMLILIAPALYNEFPLVFSDTGTYIASGMELMVPYDRPILYGLFLAVTSLRLSLWLVVIAQGALLSYLLLRVMDIIGLSEKLGFRMSVFGVITLLTGVGWYCGQLMPDIFTSTAALATYVLIYGGRTRTFDRVLTSIILVLSVGVHYSHFLIVCIILLLFLAQQRFQLRSLKRTLIPFALCLSALLVNSVTNRSIGNSFSISDGSHVFMTARLLNSGVLEMFLNDKCESHDYALCDHKDQLPESGEVLMWEPSTSPVFAQGGWEATKEPYSEMVRDIMTDPKYLGAFLYRSVFTSLSSLLQNNVGAGLSSLWYADPSSPPYREISDHFSHELRPYLKSRQNGNLWNQTLSFDKLNVFVNLFFYACALLLLSLAATGNWTHAGVDLKRLVVFVLFTMLANAFVTATLASASNRFQARVNWLLPFVVLLLIAHLAPSWIDRLKKSFG